MGDKPSWAVEFETPPVKPASVEALLAGMRGMSEIELADFLVRGVWENLVHRHDCTFALHLEDAEERAQLAWALHVILRGLRSAGYIQDDPEGNRT